MGEKGKVRSMNRPAPEAPLTAGIAAPRIADTALQPVPARLTPSGMIPRTGNNKNEAEKYLNRLCDNLYIITK